jgi:hypothetical protein
VEGLIPVAKHGPIYYQAPMQKKLLFIPGLVACLALSALPSSAQPNQRERKRCRQDARRGRRRRDRDAGDERCACTKLEEQPRRLRCLGAALWRTHKTNTVAQLQRGWNLLVFRSSFVQWQWQLSIDVTGQAGDDLADLRYATRPPR